MPLLCPGSPHPPRTGVPCLLQILPSCSPAAPGDLEIQGGLTPKEGSMDCPQSRHADGSAGNSLYRDLSETEVTPREH